MPAPDWNERYRGPEFAYGTEPNDFLVEAAGQLPPGPVLSLAEGEGRNGVYLAGRGHPVHGVDGSSVGLAKARALAAERGVELTTEVADLAGYRIAPGAWAGIVAIWVHLPREVREPLFGQVAAGLRPGGVFILEAYTPAQLGRGTGGPPDPALLISLAEWQRLLPGLEWLVAREVEREGREGRLHGGLSATVQLVGRRPA